MNDECNDKWQQFFFRVRDDVNCLVKDFFLDFFVLDRNGVLSHDLTQEFDENFESEFHTHSADQAHRTLMVNYNKLTGFFHKVIAAKAKFGSH